MKTGKQTVDEYLNSLPGDRKAALSVVRNVILKNLPQGYEEATNFGMITYQIPLARFSETYNKQPLCYAALGSHKSFMTLYLMNVYGHPPTEKWFREAYQAAGKKLDMGKSCVHFKKLEDLPLDVIGAAIARTPSEAYIQAYMDSRAKMKSKR